MPTTHHSNGHGAAQQEIGCLKLEDTILVACVAAPAFGANLLSGPIDPKPRNSETWSPSGFNHHPKCC